VVLLGPPGAGKSTLGRRAATLLGLPFFDLDALIADRAGKPAWQLLEEEGEVAFRIAELHALRTALDEREPGLVAAGSGVVTTREAQTLLRRRARLVLVDAEPGDALRRMAEGDEPRPMLGADRARWGERYNALAEARRASWESLCRERVDTTGRSIEEGTEALVALLERSDRSVPAGAGGLSLQGVSFVQGDPARALGNALASAPAAIVVDEDLPACPALDEWQEAFGDRAVLRVAAGETEKTMASAQRVAEALVDADVPPDGLVVGVGGGALLDLTGFVASTLYRGVRWVSVPTTLLAMVDASVGGKTAVNLPRGKNLLGSFWTPRSVLVDVRFSETLGPRARVAGAAEMLKHAFLVADAPDDGTPAEADAVVPAIARGDASLDDTRAAIQRSIAVKANVVSADARERGLRRVLNLGHTFGHALEHEASVSRETQLFHGEAVGYGLLFALELSVAIAGLDPEVKDRMTARVHELGLPPLPELDTGRLLDGMRVDKKRRRTGVAFVCLEGPGRPVIARDPERSAVVEAAERVLAG
jgi:shikimate kinase/3-dehydroquinate synthase